MRGRLLLAESAAGLQAADRGRGFVIRGYDPPLAVEHDHGVAAVRNDSPGAFFVHHSFTIRLPFAYPVMSGTYR